MPNRLADRLKKARQALFIGRDQELALFQDLLAAEDPIYQILYIFGPGGVGKSTLLNRFAELAAETGVRVLRADGREIDASPKEFLAALRSSRPMKEPENTGLFEPNERTVILVDTYEALGLLDAWLREKFLPALPSTTLVVLASQSAPDPIWRVDPGWRSLIYIVALRNLNPRESAEYLTLRGLPSKQRARVLSFAHGFPLALSLAADVYLQMPEAPVDLDTSPDIVQTLLERLVEKAPGPAYRSAIEACALVRELSELLLKTMLQAEDVRELFTWLSRLSCVRLTPAGLSMHEMARDALSADLRWRNRAEYEQLHRRARAFYTSQLPSAQGDARQALMMDLIYLHRGNPVVRPFFDMIRSQVSSSPYGQTLEPAVPQDHPALTEMAARHEGPESARIAARWLESAAAVPLVVHTETGAPDAWMLNLALEHATETERESDPATRTAWKFLCANSALRPGETATYFRYWMAAGSYQFIAPASIPLLVHMILHYLTTAGLAYSFFPVSDPDFWEPLLQYAELVRIPEAEFTLDGRLFAVFGHDWRALPPTAWLDLLAERETALHPQMVSRPPVEQQRIVLSRPDFDAAVLEALRAYPWHDRLAKNLLLRSRLVVASAGQADLETNAVNMLRHRMEEALDLLNRSTKTEKFARAVDLTYFHPAPTQEIASERLDVPFRTFRRHLKSGINALSEILWNWELGGLNES